MWWRGTILSTAPALMASFGIPKTIHVASSCATVTAPACFMAKTLRDRRRRIATFLKRAMSPPRRGTLEKAQASECTMISLIESDELFIIAAQFLLILQAGLLMALLAFSTQTAQLLLGMIGQDQRPCAPSPPMPVKMTPKAFEPAVLAME